MEDEWVTAMGTDLLVKFTYTDLPSGAAFMTAQIADHEVVYSILSPQTPPPFRREDVERRFALELGPERTAIKKSGV
jgi:hypothetical protein